MLYGYSNIFKEEQQDRNLSRQRIVEVDMSVILLPQLSLILLFSQTCFSTCGNVREILLQ
jgi:hypothetical protein